MAQLSDDCFASDDAPMRLAEAVAEIEARLRPVAGTETVGLDRADGRVLAEEIRAPLSLPGFDNSAVDGYAVRSADLRPDGTSLPVAARIAAGDPGIEAPAGVAVRIFTGAPMPGGFDTVFMQEDVRLDPAGRAVLPAGLKPGANRRRAGEDIREGATALEAGRRLGPAELALLGGLGVGSVAVRQPLRVGVLSTGNEIAPGGGAAGDGRLHDANRPMLIGLARRLGTAVSDLGILPDRRDAIAAALRAGAAGHDLIVTSGGISTGEEDHVRAALASVGSLAFWRVAIKPGRPVALGMVDGTPLIGLPGNPVAAFVTFVTVARPLVARLQGESYRPPLGLPVRSGFPYRKKAGRREFVRVRLEPGPDGELLSLKHPRDGAGVITSLTETDGLAVLDEERLGVEPGDTMAFLPYRSLI